RTSSVLIFTSSCLLPRHSIFPYTTLFRSSELDEEDESFVRPLLPGVVDRVPVFHPHKRVPLRDEEASGDAVGVGFISRSVQKCRSEEHTSELQSREHLVCRLLLEKKKRAT